MSLPVSRQSLGRVSRLALMLLALIMLVSCKSEEEKVADFLLKSDGRKLRIDGHTDGQPLKATKGKWGNNYRLAAERALAVREYLAGRGVPAGDMIVAGYGPNAPAVDPTAPEAEEPANRRVEIFIIPGSFVVRRRFSLL